MLLMLPTTLQQQLATCMFDHTGKDWWLTFPSQDEPDPYMKIKEFRYSISTLFMHMDNFNYLVAVTKKCCVKKMFLKFLQKSQENTSSRISFLINFQAVVM